MKRLTILLLLGYSFLGFGQNAMDYSYYKSFNLGVGYSYTYGNPENKHFHILDLGINKTKYGGHHGGGYQYGIGTEIGLNTSKFIIDPKLSGVFYFQFLAIGAEVVTYTDFDKASLRLVPILGIGSEKVRLTFNPHLVLINDEFNPIIKGLVNLSVNLTLDKQKIDKTHKTK